MSDDIARLKAEADRAGGVVSILEREVKRARAAEHAIRARKGGYQQHELDLAMARTDAVRGMLKAAQWTASEARANLAEAQR